mgnify:FL=1
MGLNIKLLINKKSVFYFLLFFILIINLALFMAVSVNYESSFCERYIVNSSEIFNLDDYIEKNPNSIKGNKVFIELNLLPDLNSLKCLGSELDLESKNKDLLAIKSTSYTLLKLVTVLSVIFLYCLFLIFQIKSTKLYFLLMVFCFFIYSYIFFGTFLLDFQLMIYPVASLLFYFLENKKHNRSNQELNFLNLFLFTNASLLIFNYFLYTQFLPLFLVIYFFYFKNTKLSNSHLNVITFSPIFYYFLRQLSGPIRTMNLLWESLSSGMYRGSPRFADMYYTFKVLKCNATGCSTKNNYGPLWEFLSIDLNVEMYSYIFSIVLIFISQKFYYEFVRKIDKKQLLIFFIYISPPTTFLMERMNFDIFVIVIGLFALRIYKNNYKNLSLFIISLLTLVKIFPFAFLMVLALYELENKNKKDFLVTLFYIFINGITYLIYFINDMQEGFIANPTGVSWTFGILSDISNSINFFGTRGLIYYLFFLVMSALIFYFLFKYEIKKEIFISNDKLTEQSFMICFLIIALYYNFDFRISIFSIGLIYFIKNYDLPKFEFLSILYLLTCVSRYFEINNYTENPIDFFYSLTFILINQITFNLLLIYLLVMIFNYLKKINITLNHN